MMSARRVNSTSLVLRSLDHISSGQGLAWLILAVMGALVLVRGGLFPGTGGDDGEQLIFSQFFDLGYQVRNPPLYTWIFTAAAEAFGPSLWAVNIVKFSLLGAIYLILQAACRRLFEDPRLATLAALSPVLCYYMAWEVVTGFSHTILVTLAYALTFLALVRLWTSDNARIVDYALLGLAIAIGGQAKYAYWIFLACLMCGALTDHRLRQRLLTPMIGVSLALAALLMAPHYVWLVGRLDILAGQAGTATAETTLSERLDAMGHAIRAAIGFLSPWWVFAVALLPSGFRAITVTDTANESLRRVIGWQVVLMLAATLVATLLFPDFRVRTHYMAALVLLPIWWMLRVEAAGWATRWATGGTPVSQSQPKRFRAYVSLVFMCLLAGPAGMLGKFLLEPQFCGRCQHHVPYAALADKMMDAGFRGGTIVAHWHPDPLPGNIRAALPKARVVSIKHGDVQPPALEAENGQCMVVWSADANGDKMSQAISAANRLTNAKIAVDTPHQIVAAPMPMGFGRAAALGFILVPGAGSCR